MTTNTCCDYHPPLRQHEVSTSDRKVIDICNNHIHNGSPNFRERVPHRDRQPGVYCNKQIFRIASECQLMPIKPNQRHKIVAKRGAAFTIMVAGESGLGKTVSLHPCSYAISFYKRWRPRSDLRSLRDSSSPCTLRTWFLRSRAVSCNSRTIHTNSMIDLH